MEHPPSSGPDDSLVDTVRALVARQLPGAPDLPIHAPLSEAGLDSLRMVATLVSIEDEFGIEMPGELITPETFHSVRQLASAVGTVLHSTRDHARRSG